MTNDTVAKLKSLRLHGMAQTWPELMAQFRNNPVEPERLMDDLLAAEHADRTVRSITYQMRIAKFPTHRDLAGFNFDEANVDEPLVKNLHDGEFMGAAQNVVLIGGPGTGKTHISTAIGVEAVQRHGKRVRFFTTVELVNTLEQEKEAGKPGQLALRLMYVDLVILDELG